MARSIIRAMLAQLQGKGQRLDHACREETVGLSMRRLQIRQFGPYFSSFLPHSYRYEGCVRQVVQKGCHGVGC